MSTKKINQFQWNPCAFLTKKCYGQNNNQYAFVVLNREVKDYKHRSELLYELWQNASVRITVDGGTDEWLKWVQAHNYTGNIHDPELITGDFDSISDATKRYFTENVNSNVTHTADQDETDYTKALKVLAQYCKDKQLELQTVLTLTDISGRFDQLLSNVQTMFKFRSIMPSVRLFQLTSDCVSWLLTEGEHTICIPRSLRDSKEWCALIPIGSACLAKTTGLKWDLDSKILEFGHLVSTSNTYNGDSTVKILVDNPLLWSMGIENLSYDDDD